MRGTWGVGKGGPFYFWLGPFYFWPGPFYFWLGPFYFWLGPFYFWLGPLYFWLGPLYFMILSKAHAELCIFTASCSAPDSRQALASASAQSTNPLSSALSPPLCLPLPPLCPSPPLPTGRGRLHLGSYRQCRRSLRTALSLPSASSPSSSASSSPSNPPPPRRSEYRKASPRWRLSHSSRRSTNPMPKPLHGAGRGLCLMAEAPPGLGQAESPPAIFPTPPSVWSQRACTLRWPPTRSQCCRLAICSPRLIQNTSRP